jgi:hypothetical protein
MQLHQYRSDWSFDLSILKLMISAVDPSLQLDFHLPNVFCSLFLVGIGNDRVVCLAGLGKKRT